MSNKTFARGGRALVTPLWQARFDRFQQRLARAGVECPYFRAHTGIPESTVTIDDRRVLSFSSYNYLGLAGHPDVQDAAVRAIQTMGISVGASRLVAGERQIHRDLESALSAFLGTEDSLALVGGYGTNETVIGHLFGPGDLILHDEWAHNSILQGATLSGANRRTFRHNDWPSLIETLALDRSDYDRVLIVIEGVYSMDGDFPELPGFLEVRDRFEALLMVDEAHSLGTLGSRGGGLSDHFGIEPERVDVWMGTLSKSLGSCGGYIAGSKELVEHLRYTTPGFVYSVGLPPPAAAAALESLRILEREPERVSRLQRTANLFRQLACDYELEIGRGNGTPIIPVYVGSGSAAIILSDRLLREGVSVQPIIQPAVAAGSARLRFFVTALHDDEQIECAVRTTALETKRILATPDLMS